MEVDLNKWYRPNVDKLEFKKLCEKSDWAGFKHVIIYFIVSKASVYIMIIVIKDLYK